MTGEVLLELLDDKGCVTSLAYSPDGRYFASGHFPDSFAVWEAKTGKKIQRISFADSQQGSVGVAFGTDSKTLATRYVRSLTLWDFASGKELKTLHSDLDISGRLVPSADRRIVASPAEEGQIALWDLTSGLRLGSILPEGDTNVPLALSPDGKFLATGEGWLDYSKIIIWELATGQKCTEYINGHRNAIECLGFSPDGRILATGSMDTTVLLWDLTGLVRKGKFPTRNLTSAKVKSLWAELASKDAARAYKAIWSLTAARRQSLALLRRQLRPIPKINFRRVAQLVADLDHDEFSMREKASAALEKMGDLAEPGIRKALAKRPSVEFRLRAQKLLDMLTKPITSPGKLRPLRAIVVLEQIASPEARLILKKLMQGAPESHFTQEAKAALQRIGSCRALRKVLKSKHKGVSRRD
jgi:hypothetical protein